MSYSLILNAITNYLAFYFSLINHNSKVNDFGYCFGVKFLHLDNLILTIFKNIDGFNDFHEVIGLSLHI